VPKKRFTTSQIPPAIRPTSRTSHLTPGELAPSRVVAMQSTPPHLPPRRAGLGLYALAGRANARPHAPVAALRVRAGGAAVEFSCAVVP
jgi:hypothetical protein